MPGDGWARGRGDRNAPCFLSGRRAAELLGELDDQALRPAHVTEEVHVLVVDDLPNRLPAAVADPVDDATQVVDLEGDVPQSWPVRSWCVLRGAGRRRVEAHHLEDVVAVGALDHHDLDLRI